MLEKMARAMRGAAEVEDGPGGPMIVNPEEMARAALLAIREPGPEIAKAIYTATIEYEHEPDGEVEYRYLGTDGAQDVFTAMIDAILNEPAPPHPAPSDPA